MKVRARCAMCLFSRGIAQTLLATNDQIVQFEVIKELFNMFQEKFNEKSIPAIVGTWRDRIIRKVSGNNDPYKNEKEISNRIALKFEHLLEKKINLVSDPYQKFRFSVLISIVGNVMEFNIQDHNITTENLEKKLENLIESIEEDLVIDEIKAMYDYLKQGLKVLYLTDNAGEILFDKFLIKTLMDKNIKVIVAVKGEPALNDAMMEDAIYVGLNKINGVELITTENDHVGIIFDEISTNFKKYIDNADLIIAKGMGYFECLFEEESLNKPIIHLFRTKCLTVANSLGIELGKNVSMFRMY
ncbi:MAG: DUF89 family protein [Candidatus Lokiarchaeota archaeon]|nr:DUF89 family protein [Candidatus Lokiarchaeota archaeon]